MGKKEEGKGRNGFEKKKKIEEREVGELDSFSKGGRKENNERALGGKSIDRIFETVLIDK